MNEALASARGQIAIRLAGLCLVGVLVTMLWLHRDWFQPLAIQQRLAHHSWAPLAFLLAHTLVGLSFVIPRTLMGVAAGLIFGFWWGLVLTVAGSMLGAWAAFEVTRLYRRHSPAASIAHRFPAIRRIEPWLARLDRTGWRGVWALRLMPFPHSPLNYALGLTSIDWTAYSIGTFLGIVPTAIVTVAIGAAGGGVSTGRAIDWIVPLALGAIGLMISLLVRRK